MALPFLDVEFFKSEKHEDYLKTKPFSKPSTVRVPLMSDSGHPPLSNTWPLAEVARFRGLSTYVADYKYEVGSLVSDLCDYGLSNAMLSKILSYASTRVHVCNSTPKVTKGRVIVCVLPFHPIWGQTFMTVARRLISLFQRELKFMNLDFSIKFCWSNAVPGLFKSLRSTQCM